MKTRVMIINLASVTAILSLLIGLAASILVFTGGLDTAAYKLILDLVSLAWFMGSPLWLVPHLFGEAFSEAGKHAWLRPGTSE